MSESTCPRFKIAGRRLAFLGVATTSAGYAFSVGQRDNTIDRDKMMTHVTEIASATDLPVSADLENGFGDSPETVAETIRLAAGTGLVGGSIEDMSKRPDHPIYELELAAERIRAAAEVARSLPFVFTLTARAENYLVGRPDLKDTIGATSGLSGCRGRCPVCARSEEQRGRGFGGQFC